MPNTFSPGVCNQYSGTRSYFVAAPIISNFLLWISAIFCNVFLLAANSKCPHFNHLASLPVPGLTPAPQIWWHWMLYTYIHLLTGATIIRTGPHRPPRTYTGLHWARNNWLFHFRDELRGVRLANYPQLTTDLNSSQSSRWVGFKVGMDVFDVSCLFSWSPSTRGSRQMLPHAS